MKPYLFILGRTPELAFLELKTFFPDITRINTFVAETQLPLPLPPADVIAYLGGTVKIAQMLGRTESISPETLVPFIQTGDGKVVFGISMYGQDTKFPRRELADLKNLLENSGTSARFVEAREGSALKSVVVAKDQIQELVVAKEGDNYVVGRTVAVQAFESWNMRDFGRPESDPKAGMLPPKVSRMAVNIADRSRDMKISLTQKTLLDPFCGMGTILSEGMATGWNVIGSDQLASVVEKCRNNLRWTTEKHLVADGVTYRLNVSDAVHVSRTLGGGSVDAIVTEPFMGDSNIKNQIQIKPQEVKNRIKGLEKLYIGCLKDWHKILKTRGVVVMMLPQYVIGGREYFVKKVIDMCENLGYTILTGPIEYSRPQAVVKRLIYVFQKV